MKRLIIFDFFGVIGAEISPRWFQNHFSEEEAKVLKDQYFEPADLGLYTIEETIHKMGIDFGFTDDEIITEWKSYVKPNNELLNKILELKKNNTVALLSNAAPNIFPLLYPMIDFNKYFDKYFFSYEHKMIKPTLDFYYLCVNSFETKFDEIYFIDDTLKNVNCLKNTNIKGVQFTSNEELFKILDKFL